MTDPARLLEQLTAERDVAVAMAEQAIIERERVLRLHSEHVTAAMGQRQQAIAELAEANKQLASLRAKYGLLLKKKYKDKDTGASRRRTFEREAELESMNESLKGQLANRQIALQQLKRAYPDFLKSLGIP